MAAIMASYDRAKVVRPDCRSDAATRPKARAALAANGTALQSDSAFEDAPGAPHARDPSSRRSRGPIKGSESLTHFEAKDSDPLLLEAKDSDPLLLTPCC